MVIISVTKVEEPEKFSPIEDINKAFELCKFGRFHVRLLVTTFSGYIASILVTNSTSYLLPVAECDLKMNLKEKGLLQAMPFIGMYISSVIIGFLTDTFGRKSFLVAGYSGLFVSSVLSALSQNYAMFATGKFGEGFFFGVSMSSLFAITSEFCHPTVRDRVLLCQGSFSAIAQIICPALAWEILPQDWELTLLDGAIVLKSWNIFLLILSLWALASLVLFTTLPESPKYLANRKNYLEARNILISVYKENSGKSEDTFPYLNLWDQQIKEQGVIEDNRTEKSLLQVFGGHIIYGLRSMKPLLHMPLMSHFIIVAAMDLIAVLTYGVLKMWYPQLSTIVEHYKLDTNQNLCDSLDLYTANEKIKITHLTLNTSSVCIPTMSGTETYVNSIIIGSVCLIPFFISGMIVNKFGKKSLLILSAVICIGAVLGIRWATSNVVMVTLFSVSVAVTQFLKTLCQVVILEVFPTSMRSVALSLISSFAIVGILLGNILFPIFLEFGCEIPFFTLTGIMILFILLSLITPKKTES